MVKGVTSPNESTLRRSVAHTPHGVLSFGRPGGRARATKGRFREKVLRVSSKDDTPPRLGNATLQRNVRLNLLRTVAFATYAFGRFSRTLAERLL